MVGASVACYLFRIEEVNLLIAQSSSHANVRFFPFRERTRFAKRWTLQLDEFAEFLNLVGNRTGLKSWSY
jgi:hypothetical protein